MLEFEGEEEKKDAKGGAKKGGQSLATAVAKQAIKKTVQKTNLEPQFKQKSFIDSREKIITLSKKSGLRQINALEVARDLRKKLSD